MVAPAAVGSNHHPHVAKRVDVHSDFKPKRPTEYEAFEGSVAWNSHVYGLDHLTSRLFVASRFSLSHATSKLVTHYMDIGELLRSQLRKSWIAHQRDNVEDPKVSEWQKKSAISPSMCQFLCCYSRRITRLDLSSIPISAHMLRQILTCCQHVQHLFLKNCMIAENAPEILNVIACSIKISGLDLSRNCFIYQGERELLAPLQFLQKLQWINLTKTVDRDGDGLAVSDMRPLAKLPQLKRVILDSNSIIGEEEDAEVFLMMRALEGLSLNDCPDITPTFTAKLRAKRPNLAIELQNSGPRAD